MSKVVSLAEAVGQVRAGDEVHVVCGHTRWTAAARELVRQWWGRDAGFTLVMASLSSLGTLFVRGGLVRRIVTGYSGDIFPTFTPNPVFGDAYRSGAVEVEHWSFLALAQRLEAGARGVPVAVTRSIAGSSMADQPDFAEVDTPFGRAGLLAPLVPDVALLHGAVADADGNVAFHPPLLEGLWGAWGARRGAIVTVERVVDDIRPWQHLVRLPAHRVLAVAECPLGAHPGGLYGTFTPAEPYGEDLAFWSEAREASRRSGDEWIRRWVLDPVDHADYLARLGDVRIGELRARADPSSWRADAAAHPVDPDEVANAWEAAATFGARVLVDRIRALGADAVLAGAGVANLAAWSAVEVAREDGLAVELTAELGLWGYRPTPADPYVFNHRSFPSASMLGDAGEVLGMVVPGPGTTTLACLGAAVVDAAGNIDSTELPGAFLVGSGGGNDVASAADEVVVMTTLTRRRTVEQVPYVTSPGERVRHLVTDLGVFVKDEAGRFRLAAVPGGADEAAAVDAVRAACGWELEVVPRLERLAPPSPAELARLRRWDPQGIFLRP